MRKEFNNFVVIAHLGRRNYWIKEYESVKELKEDLRGKGDVLKFVPMQVFSGFRNWYECAQFKACMREMFGQDVRLDLLKFKVDDRIREWAAEYKMDRKQWWYAEGDCKIYLLDKNNLNGDYVCEIKGEDE